MNYLYNHNFHGPLYSFPTYHQFCSTFHPQKFPIPDSMIYYITKNPLTPKFYQKLIKSCKYFFIKHPILVIDFLICDARGWKAFSKNIPYSCVIQQQINLNKILCKIWILEDLNLSVSFSSRAILTLSPKLFRCDALILNLEKQIISLNKLLLLTKNVIQCSLLDTVIKYQNGTKVPFEVFIQNVPTLKCLKCSFTEASYNISTDTVKELLLIPHFPEFRYIEFLNLTEQFDIESFFDFLKINRTTRASLMYTNDLSEAYMDKLNSMIDEIIYSTSMYYIPPYIFFTDMSFERNHGMNNLYCNTAIFLN